MPDYLMHRRELTIRLGDTLSPSKGSRFGSSFPTARLDVRLRRELCDQLKALASSYPGDLDDLVDQALDAGLQKIVPRLRRHFTKKKS